MATYKNAAGFSPEKIKLLEEDLAGLNESGSDLAERVVRYIVDGDDAEVLDALTRAHQAAEQLGLANTLRVYHTNRRDNSARQKFFATIDPVGHAPYLRLAKVYEAAAKSGPGVLLPFQAYYGGLPWLELFLQELLTCEKRTPRLGFPLSFLEGMLADEGEDPALLIRTVFSVGPQDHLRMLPVTTIKALPGFRDSVLKHHEVAADALTGADASRKIELLGILAEHKIPPDLFLQVLVSLATSSARTVREAAARLLGQVSQQARPLMEQTATEAGSTQRAAAIHWLGRYAGDAAREFLLARQQVEKGAKLQEAIREAFEELGSPAPTPGEAPLQPAPPLPLQTDAPLSPSARRAVADLVEAHNRATAGYNQALATARQAHPRMMRPDLPCYDQSRIDELCRLLETLTDARSFVDDEPFLPLAHGDKEISDALLAIARHPDVHLVHFLRLLVLISQFFISAGSRGRLTILHAEPLLREFCRHHSPPFTLVELAACLEAVGLDSDCVGHEILGWSRGCFRWAADSVEVYFQDRLHLLERALDNQPLAGNFRYEWRYVRKRALELLREFRHIPAAIVSRLWNIEFTATSDDRLAVEKLLGKLPDQRQRLGDALADGSYQTRLKSAEWLGRLGDKWAVPLLHKAAAKEKQDAAKDAMLTALERLGESIDRYLDRDRLLAEAERGLEKGLHKDLTWFPINSWPEVRWHDSSELVPMDILNWFLAQTNKLGSPETGALLRRYCHQFADDDREAAGMFVLRSWIEHDTRRKYTEAQARNLAKQQARQIFQAFRNAPPGSGHMAQFTLEQWEDLHYKQLELECAGSAIKQKGILALAAACCGDEAVEVVEAYLKKWYGYRAAHCRALIAMLASLDRPPAIQLLLSVANRFRTKSIREEAEKYVKLVAERKGWTIDELADRTVPTAGFDENLSIELDYGSRQLTARLRPDLTIVLTDESGKPLKSIPEPRKDDDPDKAKAAKKTLSTAKSDLKKLVAQQTARLYEAMCTERTWLNADWDAYLHRHPIVRQLCQRLVWGVVEGNKITKTFRPLDDGTLTDEQDMQVTAPADARLRLAHSSLVSRETSAAWAQHFVDYEVEPLFMQFGRDRYVLAEAKQDATELTDFEGHLIEAFKLRGQATRLGYTRGPTGDGGWFHEYEKTLAGMGTKVVIRFSGNGLPEENRTVALISLHFAPTGGEPGGFSFDQPGIPLRDVPGVLLSESYHDLATIAAAGTGYEADWQNKVGM